MKFALYLLGKKGLAALEGFLAVAGPAHVEMVYIGEDKNLTTDFSDAILRVCQQHGLKVARGGGQKASAVQADYSLAAGWRWLLPDSANCIILHDSLLPKFRGFAPLVNMLIEGERKIGVTAFRAVADYDRGPMIAQRQLEINYPIKIARAIDLVSELYREISGEICKALLLAEGPELIHQDESSASYSLWRDEWDYTIDWSLDAALIRRFVDAVGPPYTGARCYAGARALRIFEVCEISDVQVVGRSAHLGKTIFREEGRPVVICGSGLLRIDQAFDEGGEKDIAEELPFRTRFTAQAQPQ